MFKHLSATLTILLILTAVGGIGVKFYQTGFELTKKEAMNIGSQNPVAVLDRTEFDWGRIPRRPAVEEDFTLSSLGATPLQVTLVTTSCACTTAELLSDGKILSVPVSIGPSDSVTVHVSFDPDAHDSRGVTRRAVRIETNDPKNPFLIINLLADVE